MAELSIFPLLLLAYTFLIGLQPLNTAEILISPSWLSPVHRFTMRELAGELIKRNHSVTWFEYGLKNHIDIPLPKGVKEVFVELDSVSANSPVRELYQYRNHSSHAKLWDENFWNPAEQSSGWFSSVVLCEALLSDLKHKGIFDKLVAQKFETVVIDDLYNPCGLLLAGLKHSVFVYWSMTGLRTESAWANQSPSPPSYIPVASTGFTDEMNFWQRSVNLFAYMRQLYVHQHIVLRRIDALFSKHYPGKVPEAFYLERNASINLVNHPPIFDFARPHMPRVNFVGGLHCKKTSGETLPANLQKFINSSNDEQGFILITGGFTLQWNKAPKELINNLIEAIRAKPEINFVWQYNGPALNNLPKNLLTQKWLPQQQLLAHPKCRAHLSHGGLNSVIESVWHGVPVIGWPLTSAGYDNLLRVTARHAGLMLDQKQPSKMQFISAFNRIYIKFYREEMLLFQDMLIDVPYTELNHSAFWVEFIIRHQEVPHARSGADELNILQYFLIDIIVFLLSAVVLVYFALKYLLIYTIRFTVYILCLPFSGGNKGVQQVGKKEQKQKLKPQKTDASTKKSQ